MLTKQHKIGAAALAIVLVGGGVYAKHAAGNVARDQVEGFIVRQNLGGVVRYASISASLFGSVSLSDVQIKLGPNATIKVASLDISHLDIRDNRVYGASLLADGLEYPLVDTMRGRFVQPTADMQELVGLGYSRLIGRVALNMKLDDKKEALDIETTADFKDAGGWTAKLELAGITPSLVNFAYSLPEAQASGGTGRLLETALTGMSAASRVALANAEITLDDCGISKRERKITADSYPSDNKAVVARDPEINEIALIKAGQSPSKAKSSVDAYQSWRQDGGKLKITTTIEHPIPLFKNGFLGSVTPAFENQADLLALTKAEITN